MLGCSTGLFRSHHLQANSVEYSHSSLCVIFYAGVRDTLVTNCLNGNITVGTEVLRNFMNELSIEGQRLL